MIDHRYPGFAVIRLKKQVAIWGPEERGRNEREHYRIY